LFPESTKLQLIPMLRFDVSVRQSSPRGLGARSPIPGRLDRGEFERR